MGFCVFCDFCVDRCDVVRLSARSAATIRSGRQAIRRRSSAARRSTASTASSATAPTPAAATAGRACCARVSCSTISKGELIASGRPRRSSRDAEVHADRRSDRRRRRLRPHLPRRRLRRIARQAAEHRRRRRQGGRGVLRTRSARRAIRRPAICAASRPRSPIRGCCSRPGCCRAAAPGAAVRRRCRCKPTTVTVTLPSGEKVEGTLDRIDDFVVALTQADGTHRSFSTNGDTPKVEIHDPLQPHKDLLRGLLRHRHPQRDGLSGDLK